MKLPLLDPHLVYRKYWNRKTVIPFEIWEFIHLSYECNVLSYLNSQIYHVSRAQTLDYKRPRKLTLSHAWIRFMAFMLKPITMLISKCNARTLADKL